MATASLAQPCVPQWLPQVSSDSLNGSVFAFARMNNGDLAAAGYFTTASGKTVNRVARWDGREWFAIGGGVTSAGYPLATAVAPNGDLIVGGYFTHMEGRAVNYIARWDGTTWHPMGQGLGAFVAAITTLPNGDVIAGGRFSATGAGAPANRVARWDGTTWSALGAGFNNDVQVLSVHNGQLIAGGRFTSSGSIPTNCIAKWDGSLWLPLGSGMTNWVNWPRVTALFTMPNGDLVAGGAFFQAGGTGATCVARWNGSTWSSIGPGINGEVRGLTLVNDQLVAAGDFTSSGIFSTMYIAFWNGTYWLPVDEGVDQWVFAICPLGDGEFALGGEFTLAGGAPHASWARHTLLPSPRAALHPLGRSLAAGDTLTLTAAPANGYEFVSWQWRREAAAVIDGLGGASAGGGVVTGASGTLPSPTNNTVVTLTITGVQVSDAGLYDCVFSNACGDATATQAGVTVTGGPVCDSIDFNNDTLFPDTLDISDFLTVFAGGVCDGQQPTDPPCNTDIDFNNDGLFPDTLDIDSLLSVFSGGACL